ncbi:MAG: hypothetical protein Q9N68_07725, partial [Gammaproteobacteria bacterium]|nr:hypothetical protein [Gammaproteobacteria bacterium]
RLSEQSEEAAGHIDTGIEKVIQIADQQMKHILDPDRIEAESQRLNGFVSDLSDMANMYDELEQLNQTVFRSTSESVDQITGLTVDAFARVQFQDITRQRLEQIKAAHELIDQHIAAVPKAILDRETFYELDTLNLDELYEGYYMEDQRLIHDKVNGQNVNKPATPELPAIELF